MQRIRWSLTAALVALHAAGVSGRVAANENDEAGKPGSRGEKRAWRDYPKLSPFAAVRWRGLTPRVEVDGNWYELLAIDEIDVRRIVTFCQTADKKDWKKRFEEDLVEILARMRHDVGKTVKLKLRELDGTKAEVVKDDVPLTEDNRRAILKQRLMHQKPDRPNRVRREHAREVPDQLRRLATRLDSIADLRREEVEDDLDQLEYALETRFAYLERKGVDYRAALDAVRGCVDDGISRRDFAVQLAKVLALFGDGHTRVAGAPDKILPAGYLPFLVGQAEGVLVAFKEDRSDFIDPNCPFLRRMDGLAVDEWLRAAAALAPCGSAQQVRRQSIRNLRFATFLRRELNLPAAEGVELVLESRDGRQTHTATVPLTSAKPLYGTWPRGSHRLLEGNIGYLRIDRMDDDPAYLAGLKEAMHTFRQTRGLIVDVRGNGGGSRAVLRELLPFFVEPTAEPQVVNVAAYRLGEQDQTDEAEGFLADRFCFPSTSAIWSGPERSAIEWFAAGFVPEWTPPEGKFSGWHYLVLSPSSGAGVYHYKSQVVVLMDEDCFSATDVFLGALKGRPNVSLLGRASGGGSGRPEVIELAHSGVRVYLSTMASFQSNGQLYDGRGILPDVELNRRATDLIGTTDSYLDAALTMLARKSTGHRR